MKQFKIFIFLIIVVVLLSCINGKRVIKEENFQGMGSENYSPNGCTINGTVIGIYDKLDTGDTMSACSKVPCNALIKIDNILERGMGFSLNIEEGMEIKVHFIFTLSPTTDKLFPGIKKHFPGLNINDKFRANLQGRLEAGKDSIFAYIYEYDKL